MVDDMLESKQKCQQRGGGDMTVDRIVMATAGTFILASLLLAVYHSQNWLWFTAFVGANLLQSAFTGLCPSAKLFKMLGIKPGKAFD